MAAPPQEPNFSELLPTGLVIIARDSIGQVITRLTCTRSREVVSAMRISTQCPPAQDRYRACRGASARGSDLELSW